MQIANCKFVGLRLDPRRYTLYLVDDVSVIESDLPADAGPDRHIGKDDSTYIGRPKEVGLECSWSVLGSPTIVGKGAGIWVKPTTTTSYVITQTLCGQVKEDTVRVEVWGVGIASLKGQMQEYSIAPNPNEGAIHLQQAVNDDRPCLIEAYEVTGKRVFTSRSSFIDGRMGLNLSDLAAGLYYLVVRDNSGRPFVLKFVRK